MKQTKFDENYDGKTNNDRESKSETIQHIEKLARKLEGSNMSDKKLQEVEENIACLESFMGVSRIQVMLFTAVVIINLKKRRVSLDNLSNYFKCPGIQIMQMLPELKELQKKKWIKSDVDGNARRSMLSDISYYVVREVFDRIFFAGNIEEESNQKKDIYRVLSDLIDLVAEYDRERISHEELIEDTQEILDLNLDLPFFKQLKKQGLDDKEKYIFCLVCQRTLMGDPEVDIDRLVDLAALSSYERMPLKRSILRKKSKLISCELIKLQDGMFRANDEVMLTDFAIKTYFPNDADILIQKEGNTSNLIKLDSLKPVKLFFNDKENDSLRELKKLLTRTGYNGVVRRLKKENMRCGFTVLFHGSPGTGKTEAVNQLALKTGREVMRVDLSQTKSMWFGESEKKIQGIFTQYRQLFRFSDNPPILLFNEADGIFGARGATHNSNTSQTFNTMQNILLEEMENFEGILIATTNLTSNFDKAFERRFLYKIEFTKSDMETRRKIWRSKISKISLLTAGRLSQEFEFSGGQIENITRKFIINSVLSQVQPSHHILSAYCREEQIQKSTQKNMGFKRLN
jgi:hypothetical protein